MSDVNPWAVLIVVVIVFALLAGFGVFNRKRK